MVRLIAGNKAVECKLVIFDKDGTLVDYRQVDLELAKARRKSIEGIMGKEIADFWERAVGFDLKQSKLDYCGPLGTASAREELLVAATAFYLKGCPWDEARELAQKAYEAADGLMKSPYGSIMLDGVTSALRKLERQGLKLAIASTYAHKRTAESLKTLRIASLFDAIVGPEDVANGKSLADMILELLRRTGCNAHEAVMVGDSVSDMKMGKNAKVKSCIGVLTGISQRVDLEDYANIVIDSVAQLDAQSSYRSNVNYQIKALELLQKREVKTVLFDLCRNPLQKPDRRLSRPLSINQFGLIKKEKARLSPVGTCTSSFFSCVV